MGLKSHEEKMNYLIYSLNKIALEIGCSLPGKYSTVYLSSPMLFFALKGNKNPTIMGYEKFVKDDNISFDELVYPLFFPLNKFVKECGCNVLQLESKEKDKNGIPEKLIDVYISNLVVDALSAKTQAEFVKCLKSISKTSLEDDFDLSKESFFKEIYRPIVEGKELPVDYPARFAEKSEKFHRHFNASVVDIAGDILWSDYDGSDVVVDSDGVSGPEKLLELVKNSIEKKEERNNGSEFSIPNELRNFLVDMTAAEKEKGSSVQIVKGRDAEVFDILCTLSKHTKSNAILVGKAGVGKTAVVEEIARRLANNDVPDHFKNYKLLSLEINGLVAGTRYRGDMEEKLSKLVDFLSSRNDVICFIDEIHSVMSAGKTADDSNGVVTSLKPFLARSSSKVIGATTHDEIDFLKKDPAFERRFDVIEIKEPPYTLVKEMVSERIKQISEYHKISYTDNQLDDIIEKCREIKNRAFPDKVIDVVDCAMAMSKMNGESCLSNTAATRRLSLLKEPEKKGLLMA